jgi:PAS domain S-box-containing protein
MTKDSDKSGPVSGIASILIVDDNDSDRLVLRYYLEHFHCRILEAADGAEGLAVALREKPCLIISDALMPGMDGFQFLREVRRSPEIRDVPFIFYSAVYTGQKDEELARSLGADDFIVKPLEPDEFNAELTRVLRSLEKERPSPSAYLLESEEEYLRSYSDVVAAKLEEKVRELSASEGKFRKFFAGMRDVVVIVDGDRIILDANEPALTDAFGYSRDEVVERNERILFPDESAYRKMGDFLSLLSDTHTRGLLETVYRRKNGELFHAEVSGNRLMDERDTVSGYISVIRDITEKKKLEEQLHHAQKMEALGTLASGIAHDFNNIISAIIGFSSIAQMRLTHDDPLQGTMREILSAGERAAALTRGILDYSRRDLARKEPVDINEVILQSSKFLQRVIGEDVLLDVKTGEEGLIVLGDRGELEQVFMNLATNARDAMPEGGKLLVETGRFEMGTEFIAAHGFGKAGEYILITVTDTGLGIDEATRKRIFEPFFTTKGPGKGTGLGLSIIYGIIKQHQGFINVYSEPGRGTTFRIYLPVVSAARKAGYPSMCAMRGGNETLLVVEDSDEIRSLFIMILKEFGYNVHNAANGNDALRIMEELQGRVDLALLDIILPGKNGRQVLDDLLSISPRLKYIFMSGYPRDIVSGKGLLEEGCECLQKPLAPHALLGKIREVLDGN